jgi:hypothetical protein
MRRTLRILAVCALAFSILEAWYSLARLVTYSDVFVLFPTVLRTTNVALGIATAVVALVDSAQQRRWWLTGAFAVLVLLIAYAQYLPYLLAPLIPALNSLSEVAGLRLFLLSYAVPTILTALLMLAGEILPRPGIPRLSPAHEHDEGLEIHFSSLDR